MKKNFLRLSAWAVALLQGDADKAEVYLRMAEADGVGQARAALRMLLWQK